MGNTSAAISQKILEAIHVTACQQTDSRVASWYVKNRFCCYQSIGSVLRLEPPGPHRVFPFPLRKMFWFLFKEYFLLQKNVRYVEKEKEKYSGPCILALGFKN